jgi:serine/threonine protein kinase
MIYVQHGHNSDRGSFAVVVPALEVDDETGICRQVAVKRVRPRSEFPTGSLNDQLHEQASRLFERERRIWCTLSPHPGVVPALRASRIDGEAVLLLEYIYGPSLEEVLAGPNGPLNPVDLLSLLDQLASALRHLHEHSQLAHGDVSTQNLLYDGEGLIRLADLGLASRIGEGYELAHFQLSLSAPEQSEALQVSPAVDVWKAAVCVLLAARGESLSSFITRRPNLTSQRHCKLLVEESLELAMGDTKDRKLAGSLKDLLLRGLTPDPTKRLQDGGELAEAVRELLAQNPRWNGLLERQRLLRSRLHFWNGKSPRTANEALTELKSISREMLSADYVSPAHRLLPENPFLLARAAWLSSGGKKDQPELLELARWHAQMSINSFDGDPRPIEIMVNAGKALREATDRRGTDFRNERDLVRLFRKFKTFVNAHKVRELERDLIQMELLGSKDAAVLLQEVHVALSQFDERLLLHYKNLEDRLIDRKL